MAACHMSEAGGRVDGGSGVVRHSMSEMGGFYGISLDPAGGEMTNIVFVGLLIVLDKAEYSLTLTYAFRV